MNCPTCGYWVVSSATTVVCPRCDHSFLTSMPQSDATQPSVTPPMSSLGFDPALSRTPPRAPRKRTRLMIGLALAVIIIAAGAGSAYLIGKSGGPSGSVAEIATATGQPTATTPPTAIPTATRPPAPTATPAPRLVTLFFDPLTSNKNGWPTDGSYCYFAPDGYHVTNGSQCYAPIKPQTNVNISVTMKFTVANEPVSSGIGFRVVNGWREQYYFGVSSTGGWFVLDPSHGMLVPPTASSAIRRAAGALNTLEVDCSGTHFSFFINGINVGSDSSSAYASGGIGLEIEYDQAALGYQTVFTNFKITQWQ